MKKKVIIISIVCSLVAILALTAIIFSAVFRVKHYKVGWVGDKITITSNDVEHEITDNEIFSASGIKTGSSSLFLDKEAAKSKLEASYPNLKVLQIRLTGARTLEFRLTARHEMFYYTLNNNQFYVLDEELKVLKILSQQPENLVPIDKNFKYLDDGNEKIDTNFLNVNDNTKIGNFVGNAQLRSVFNSLYVAIYKFVLVNQDGSLWLNKLPSSNIKDLLESETIRYIEREDYNKIISNISLERGYSKKGNFIRLELVTKAGVKVVIDAAECDLENKINKCFSMVSSLDGMGENYSSKSGTVSFKLDANGQGKTYYEK